VARVRLGDLMLKAGLIDEHQLQAALALQKQWGGRLGHVLVEHGFIDEMMLWMGLSHQLGVPLVSLPTERIAPALVGLLPAELYVKHAIFPVSRDDKGITVATSDPYNLEGIDEVTFRVGARVKLVLAPHREIEWAIRYYCGRDPSPCPPPRTKRPALPDVMTLVHDDARTEAAATHVTPKSSMPTPVAGQSAGQSAVTLETLAATLKETDHVLGVLIEACVHRGVFTHEQFLAKLREQG
jgi:type IV pilus assembly protein PilB